MDLIVGVTLRSLGFVDRRPSLAISTVACPGDSSKPRSCDRLLAGLAHAVAAMVNPAQCFFDSLQELPSYAVTELSSASASAFASSKNSPAALPAPGIKAPPWVLGVWNSSAALHQQLFGISAIPAVHVPLPERRVVPGPGFYTHTGPLCLWACISNLGAQLTEFETNPRSTPPPSPSL